jgi:histidinol-phosphate aminotransferase
MNADGEMSFGGAGTTARKTYERPAIEQLVGYIPGKQQPPGTRVAKLNANENPFPPSRRVREAISAFDTDRLRLYPQATADRFRETAAALHGVASENIMAVNGGDELIRLAIATFVNPGACVGVTHPCYGLYRLLAAINESPLIELPVWPDGLLPENAAEQLNSGGVRLAILTNPQAPLGTLAGVREIVRLARAFEGVLLVDEAYVDFVDPTLGYDLVPLVHELDNLLILRSLSKGYSLAGIRFGYAIGSTGLIAPMMGKTRDSYNVDALSQAAAIAALEGRDEAEAGWEIVRTERNRLGTSLRCLGCEVPASQTNFLLVRPGGGRSGAMALFAYLERRGVLVRYFDETPIDNWLRVSIGTPAENDLVLDGVAAFLLERAAK